MEQLAGFVRAARSYQVQARIIEAVSDLDQLTVQPLTRLLAIPQPDADPGATVSHHDLTIDDLEHWTTSGAHWRVVDISSERVVVDLCACTGEPMERVESEDPAVIGYLRTAPSHLDPDQGG